MKSKKVQGLSRILKDAVAIGEYAKLLKRNGKEAIEMDVELSPSIGIFTEAFPEWKADDRMQTTGSICKYKGIAYQCKKEIQRSREMSPDKAADYYHPFPEPDKDGNYPYVYGMKVREGMRIKDPNGKKYKAMESIEKMQNPPSEMTEVFREG